jgi:hypothetical protein
MHTITASVTDSGGLPGLDQISVTVTGNTAPAVTIAAPTNGTNVTEGDIVFFTGTAMDAEDGDVTASLAWESSIDGSIGSGGSFSTSTLSVGMHMITASVTDSGGLPGLDQISVTVSEPGSTLHVGDLDGNGLPAGQGGKWNATVTVFIHDANDNPIADATVAGTWSAGADGSGSCATVANGECSVTRNNINRNRSSVTFTVSNVSHATNNYLSGDNHDPDGDSNGTSIVVAKP